MSKERRLLSPFLHADILLFAEQIFKTFAEYDDILQKMTVNKIEARTQLADVPLCTTNIIMY